MVANSSNGRATTSESCRMQGKSTVTKGKQVYKILESENPVVESSEYILKNTDLVALDREGIENAARYITRKLAEESYNPTTWRTHELHLCPPARGARGDPLTKDTLNWLFLVSALNFSFWSDLEGTAAEPARYGVDWRAGWESDERRVWTGYWSLVAAIDRALENGIPITNPAFYSDAIACPDSLIAAVFAAAAHCVEGVPLLEERIKVMREVGAILCKDFGGGFQGFMDAFEQHHGGPGQGTALQLVRMVTETFPAFRDAAEFEGRTVYFWKRAQILVAELWAAFYPPTLDADGDIPSTPTCSTEPHPFLPGGVGELTMFADYRVPQIMHHLRILSYSPQLTSLLERQEPIAHGSVEELTIRAGSILGVEAVRAEMLRLARERGEKEDLQQVSSVLIDFYLWDLAKRIEGGEEVIEGIATQPMLPPHRTRSIWY